MGYKFEKYSIGGGGSGVGEYINMECYYKWGAYADSYYTLAQLFMGAGYSPAITYYVVDALPENPNVTNMATANPAHVYIYNNVPYVYGNAGYGDMWMGVVDVLAVLGDITTTAKGFTSDITKETEEGVYVTYLEISEAEIDRLNSKVEALNTQYNEITEKSERMRSILTKTTQVIDLTGLGITKLGDFAFRYNLSLLRAVIPAGIETVGSAIFSECSQLNDVTIQEGVMHIGGRTFEDCPSLKSLVFPDGFTTLGSAMFDNCSALETITIPISVTNLPYMFIGKTTVPLNIIYKGTKAQWKAITKAKYWDMGTPDYTITCTDGTIAKDGTES